MNMNLLTQISRYATNVATSEDIVDNMTVDSFIIFGWFIDKVDVSIKDLNSIGSLHGMPIS